MRGKIIEDKLMRSIVSGFIAIFLCMMMLVGTTYAWFTSTITTGGNIIKSANFDVTLEYSDAFDGDYLPLTNASVLFNDILLAPTESTTVKYIKITNLNDYPIQASVSIGDVTTTAVNESEPEEEPAAETPTHVSEMKLAYEIVTEETAFSDEDFVYDLEEAEEILSSEVIDRNGSVIVAIAIKLPETAQIPGVKSEFSITVGVSQYIPVAAETPSEP